MRGGCVSETEKREEEYREAAHSWSNNALAWGGFAITEFVLVVSIFTAFKVETTILFQFTVALSIIDGLLFATSSTLYSIAVSPAHRLWKVKDKRTGKPMANPRQLVVKRAERLFMAGLLLQTLWMCAFLVFLQMYWVSAIVFVVAALLYLHIMPLTPFIGENEPKQN
jgi:NADH:ubiquinone oxidoreductase subunit 3 (subunit A)